ncbi:ABC transporter ATP-binding protein [Treponema putidum]|uniref:ATP-binding cassette domain-containing protein n=1 Tax=Treponema putidum TaxID=221027 RepID=A0AAE9SJN3_9SPIR|nr:ATP-binding cassette domain-containing protein [Treponema putidum]AIN93028.1 ABC transporter ATPase [Treponema putidum]TWI78502.1 oligopeptide transport system ATP-binding protein [Treponema putidum]UTY29270.1 ATP-binding cassette domain-containing protein [Treponema putidum]UTY31767.1 ATP-binding cassette domain-containing protein [Treponema putidum]UTY34126.1 ATP-binding cassette domain-containing protein [Treponema putidum]
MNNNDLILRVNNLKQYFKLEGKYLKAVDDVSFDVHKGEVFGIVGESGCGKTTIGRSIIGLYEITGGDIYYKDHHINSGLPFLKERIKEARASGNKQLAEELEAKFRVDKKMMKKMRYNEALSDIQMIFQDPISSLDPRMTVREIIGEGMIIRGERDMKKIDAKVKETLNLVGLVAEHAERYPHEFSGGQRQRIGIARAIVMNPEIIIADEPISALDVSVQAQVINLMNDLRREMNLTILFIAHDLAVVKYFSNRIAVMYYGRMVELADSDELFAHPFHPYTRALLSAIPVPDPNTERNRKREVYVPALAHDYSVDKPKFREVREKHWVLCNDAEYEKLPK